MTKERELLRRALEVLDEKVIGYEITKGAIRTYLSTTSDDAEEPEAKPVLYIKEQELLYIQVLKQEGLAQEWKSNLGFVKEDGDVGLYLHPPKPAEPARKPMTSEEMEKQYEIDKEYFGESVMRAFYNGIRFAEKHHKIGEYNDKQG